MNLIYSDSLSGPNMANGVHGFHEFKKNIEYLLSLKKTLSHRVSIGELKIKFNINNCQQ